MIDLGKAYQSQCQAALDAFRKELNLAFERATTALDVAQTTCLKTIAEADEQFSVAVEARVSGAGLAIANTVRQFVGEGPLDSEVAAIPAHAPRVKSVRDTLEEWIPDLDKAAK